MTASGNRNGFSFFIFVFFLLTLQITAEENKKWDIEKAVSTGLKNSYPVQTERENLYKKQLSLKSVKPFGNISADFKGNMVLNWLPDQNISLSESLNSAITFPVLKQIDVITEYTMERGSLAADANDDKGSFLLGINIKPLQNLKEVSDYESALYSLDKEKLSWTNSLIKTEFGIRSAYIKAVENISVRKLLELKFINSKNIWIENKKRFELGLISGSTLENSLLKKLKTAESLEQSREDEYISLLKLSRLINVDLSEAELKPLLPFKSVKIDKEQLVQSALFSNILLKQSILKLKIMKKSARIIKNDFMPDISIVPGVEIPVTDPENWTSGISVNIEFSLDRSNIYTLEKRNIDIMQQERKIKMIRNTIVDNISIALYDFNTEQKKLEYLTAFLNQKNITLIEKENAFREKSLLSTELETARINVLNAKNDLQTTWNDLWLTWYSLEAVKNGYAGSLE